MLPVVPRCGMLRFLGCGSSWGRGRWVCIRPGNSAHLLPKTSRKIQQLLLIVNVTIVSRFWWWRRRPCSCPRWSVFLRFGGAGLRLSSAQELLGVFYRVEHSRAHLESRAPGAFPDRALATVAEALIALQDFHVAGDLRLEFPELLLKRSLADIHQRGSQAGTPSDFSWEERIQFSHCKEHPKASWLAVVVAVLAISHPPQEELPASSSAHPLRDRCCWCKRSTCGEMPS